MASEEFSDWETQLFGPGFLDKASKRIKSKKSLTRCQEQSLLGRGNGRMMEEISIVFIQRHFCKVQRQEDLVPSSVVQLTEVTVQYSAKCITRAPNREHRTPRGHAVSLPGTSPKIFVAEGVALNWDVWETLTSDDWVLEVVQGYRLELWQQPYQRASAVTRPGSQEEWRLIDREIQELLQKIALEEVSPSPEQFVSCLFLIPKKDGLHHPVFNLKPLNRFMKSQHFKILVVKELVQQEDWMSTVDLKDDKIPQISLG